MRLRVIWVILICGLSVACTTSNAATIPATAESNVTPPNDAYSKITSLKLKDVKKLLGRKLTIKEKIGFIVLKHKLKHPPKHKDSENKGATSQIFGIVGIALFVIGLFVPYVILASLIAAIIAVVTGSVAKRQNPDDRKAHAGKLLGWITLGLITLLLLLAVALIASFSWG
jgi:hypothetical protein